MWYSFEINLKELGALNYTSRSTFSIIYAVCKTGSFYKASGENVGLLLWLDNDWKMEVEGLPLWLDTETQ